ncbi:MFS transporter, putative metabolite transport protein [Saccharopolyspora shandongensis]|uniref:MFS transporter, putative metabolite transport protein n=1 Tax=Saccharopolyspora shandongensis TaxID=418495 RepID=A0A1H3Q123_9PSEU|nr:MFS transporter [Saccharopolyspora shandongensis]SDZ07087.1 MFS transporter, putative metabolite transport protein [Saccharopolyspora shandongensis]
MNQPTPTDETGTAEGSIALDQVPFGRFHLKVTAMTFGANFSDGYALGIIGSALPLLTDQWNVNGFWQGMLASSALIGLFFGSLILGPIADKIGRQRVYVLNFILIAIASLLQFWAPNVETIFILRLLIGFGLGADYAVGPTLLSEFAPRKSRGLMLSSLTVLWTVGYVIANILGTYVTVGSDTWRWLLASGCIPAAIVLVIRIGSPESPGWLMSKGRAEEARAIVTKYLKAENVRIPKTHTEDAGQFSELFSPALRKNTWFGILFFSAQVLPYFAIYTFVSTILGAMNVSNENTQNVLINLFLLVGGVVGVYFIDKMPRRGFTLWTFVILAGSLLVLGIVAHANPWLMMIPFIIYSFVMSGASNITQVYPPELFPTRLRGTGVGLLNATSRISSAIGTFLLPISITHWGVSNSMYWLAAVLAFGAVITYFWAPNTESQKLV